MGGREFTQLHHYNHDGCIPYRIHRLMNTDSEVKGFDDV
jgi:hypothetical protein